MDSDSELYLCQSCLKDAYLKRYFDKVPTITQLCYICLRKSSKCLQVTNNREFSQIFKAIIRYHYSEFDYNYKLEGCRSDIINIFEHCNPILSHEYCMDRDENYLGWIVTLLIEPIVGTIDTQIKDGVSLYSNLSPPFISNLQEDFSSVCGFFMHAIEQHGPKAMEPEAVNYLAPYVTKFTLKITRNRTLYRARLGYKKRGHKYDHLDDTIIDVFFPFAGKDISAPPIDKTRNNRLNQQGHSFLYLSSNETTALSEIKPYPGQFVSLGQFYPKKNLFLADLNNLDFSNYWLTDAELDIYVFLRTLGYWYSFPVQPDSNQSLYYTTQFFSAVFKALGFDGITYRSSITDGTNYVVFQPGLMRYRRSSGKCVNVKSLAYTYKSVFYETSYAKSDYVSYDMFSTNSDHTSHIYKEP